MRRPLGTHLDFSIFLFLFLSRMCTFIPKEIKDEYMRLKDMKGLTRGRKRYWVSAASRIGLCDGEKGIVLSSST